MVHQHKLLLPTLNWQNLYYMLDTMKNFKILINTGAGWSIFTIITCKNYSNRLKENITIEFSILMETQRDSHKIFICNLNI